MNLFPNREQLRGQFTTATPFPFVEIQNFLDPAFARRIAEAYPPLEVAKTQGRSFSAVNEKLKIQITDAKQFTAPIVELNDLLASPDFLRDLSYITNIPTLLADERLSGGGMHMTGPGGRLDVHIDFNFIDDRQLHRRLNLLLYLNPIWEPQWGGQLQLWDKTVKNCEVTVQPQLNRCVIFETNEISYHGVVPISPLAPYPRISFATYYYTKEAPAHWDGNSHTTIFKARPEEKFRKLFLMPAEAAKRKFATIKNGVKSGVKRLIS
jgi:Rps23 Pro-64 3,4-dihydroxylase Tpa1-like proline 4-hydroxylase